MGTNPSPETPKKFKKNWLPHNIKLLGVRMWTAATASCAIFMWSQLCEYLYFQTLVFPSPEASVRMEAVVVGIILWLMIFRGSNLADGGCTWQENTTVLFLLFFVAQIAEQGLSHDIRFYTTELTMWLCNRNVIIKVWLRVLDEVRMAGTLSRLKHSVVACTQGYSDRQDNRVIHSVW